MLIKYLPNISLVCPLRLVLRLASNRLHLEAQHAAPPKGWSVHHHEPVAG